MCSHMAHRIHIFGASGCGTTTLGRAVGSSLSARFLDTDSFYWKETDPPFIEKNPREDRIAMIKRATRGAESWVLSGSICGWGDPLVRQFSLAVFLYLDPTIRMERLRDRERDRYGERIEEGGDMYQTHRAFIAWAESYDHASAPTRSLDLHTAWMRNLECPILQLDSHQGVDQLAQRVVDQTTAQR